MVFYLTFFVFVGVFFSVQTMYHHTQVTTQDTAYIPFVEHVNNADKLHFVFRLVIYKVHDGDAEFVYYRAIKLFAIAQHHTLAADIALRHLYVYII